MGTAGVGFYYILAYKYILSAVSLLEKLQRRSFLPLGGMFMKALCLEDTRDKFLLLQCITKVSGFSTYLAEAMGTWDAYYSNWESMGLHSSPYSVEPYGDQTALLRESGDICNPTLHALVPRGYRGKVFGNERVLEMILARRYKISLQLIEHGKAREAVHTNALFESPHGMQLI